MEFKDKIGQVVIFHIPFFDPIIFQELKIHGVEQGGLWVESQKMTNALLSKFGVPVSSKTMVFFLPYHQISFAMDSIDQPSISEKSFGV